MRRGKAKDFEVKDTSMPVALPQGTTMRGSGFLEDNKIGNYGAYIIIMSDLIMDKLFYTFSLSSVLNFLVKLLGNKRK
jgi:hypothetical protein